MLHCTEGVRTTRFSDQRKGTDTLFDQNGICGDGLESIRRRKACFRVLYDSVGKLVVADSWFILAIQIYPN